MGCISANRYIEQFVKGQGAIDDFLAKTYKAYREIRFGGSKEIWDIVAIGYLINSDWVPSYITSCPMVAVQPPIKEPGPNPYPRDKHQLTWSFDHSRHSIRYAYYVQRDPIFRDLFSKLERFANG